MTEAPLRACPQCRGRVKRLIGRGAGIIFKGSGFYETDYRRAGRQEPAAQAPASSPAGGPADKGGGATASAAPAPKASCEAAK